MTLTRIVQFVPTVVVLALMIHWSRRGYHRRRAFWSSGSWLRFVAACGAGLVIALAPAAMELALDLGLVSRASWSPDARAAYALGAVALMLLGALVLVVVLWWFAHSEPSRQFPGGATVGSQPSIVDSGSA